MTATVLASVRDGVATITLNRPERRNAYILEMGLELSAALSRCDGDDDIRAVVLTGAGETFCAGADLDPRAGAYGASAMDRFLAVQDRLLPPYRVRKPVIAAVNGHAVGIGMTLALQCDVRYASEDAKLGFPFVRLGIVPENAATWLLPRVVGLSRAAELLLSGRLVSGAEAASMGLVSSALPAAGVLPAATGLAQAIAQRAAPVPVALTKRLLWQGLEGALDDSARDELGLLAWTARQADAAEGARAFKEKRLPRWQQRVSADLPPQDA